MKDQHPPSPISWRDGLRVAGLLILVNFCIFELILYRESVFFREYEWAFLSIQWMPLCIAFWCGCIFLLKFNLYDLPFIILLGIAFVVYFIGYSTSPSFDVIKLLFGGALGKGVAYSLKGGKWEVKIIQNAVIRAYLFFIVILLAFSAWWHLETPGYYYQGSRWIGLWDNPNIYGMLMGAGTVLAIGLLKQIKKEECRKKKLMQVFLPVAIFIMGVGLVMSYSRGAWLATGVGVLYLVWCHGKLKWLHILPIVAVVVAVVLHHWGSTSDSAPWYVKRADLARPAAQNRATAWRAGFEIMWDHPLGVGWNNAEKIYGDKYHPPAGGPAALITNDYLMIGTELGIPALVCFVVYVWLCYRKSPRPFVPVFSLVGGENIRRTNEGEALRAACLAGALVFVVAFWFDGGLFQLPTAAMFWVLLELGRVGQRKLIKGVENWEIKVCSAPHRAACSSEGE